MRRGGDAGRTNSRTLPFDRPRGVDEARRDRVHPDLGAERVGEQTGEVVDRGLRAGVGDRAPGRPFAGERRHVDHLPFARRAQVGGTAATVTCQVPITFTSKILRHTSGVAASRSCAGSPG